MGIISKFVATGAVAAIALLAAQASAGVVTINFAGNGGVQSGSSMVFTNGGVSVTVAVGAFARDDEFNISSRIVQNSNGLGNLSNYSYIEQEEYCAVQGKKGKCAQYGYRDVVKNAIDGNSEVDDGKGNGVREFLTLDFAGLDVQILSIDFGAHDASDKAIVNINNNSTQIFAGNTDPITLGSYTATSLYWILAGSTGRYDGRGHPDNGGHDNGGNDNNDWNLKSVTFSFADPVQEPGPAPQDQDVPVPAALSLLGLGLAGLGILRRRRG